MPLYQDVFGIDYILRTQDIDFAVEIAHCDRTTSMDLEKTITNLGYIPVMMQSGIRKFTRENFTVEFIVHRKGARDDSFVPVRLQTIIGSLKLSKKTRSALRASCTVIDFPPQMLGLP